MGTRKKIEGLLSRPDRDKVTEIHDELCRDADADGAPRPPRWEALAFLVGEALRARRAREAQAVREEQARAAERREAEEKAKAAAVARAAQQATERAAEAWYRPRLDDLAAQIALTLQRIAEARREAGGTLVLPVGCTAEEWQKRREEAEARAARLEEHRDVLQEDARRLREQFEAACPPHGQRA